MADKQQPTKAWGVASLVLAILSILLFLAPYFGLPLAIAAVVFYGIQKKHGSTGPATAGLVIGIIGIIVNAVTLIIVIGALALFNAIDTTSDTSSEVERQAAEQAQNEIVETTEPVEEIEIISTDFFDFGKVYCDSESTGLQKKTLFEDEFKGEYVRWEGEVGSIEESRTGYTMTLYLCDDEWAFTPDIEIQMLSETRDELLSLSADDTVTVQMRLNSMNGIFVEILADRGLIVS